MTLLASHSLVGTGKSYPKPEQKWEYVKGSEADFIGHSDEWVSMWQDTMSSGPFFAAKEGVGFSNMERFKLIAERRKVDNLQSRVNDANLGDALKEMFKDVPSDAVYDKYNRLCKGVTIDVYDVLVAFNVTNPALQHLIKKALAVGQRGHKDKNEDLNDILASAKRAIELEGHYK